MNSTRREQVLTFAGFLLVLLATVGTWLSVAALEGDAPDFVQMYIATVIEVDAGRTYAVVLTDAPKDAKLGMLVFIGEHEARAILHARQGIQMPRPMTHDLLKDTIEKLGATIEKVLITRIEGGTFFGEIILKRGDETIVIDCRPSDAMALAVRAEAPIYVATPVLEQAGRSLSEDGEDLLPSAPRPVPPDAI